MEQFQNIIHKKANERQQDVHCSMGLYQIIIDNYIANFKIDRNAKTEYGYYITVYTLNGKGGYRLTLDGQSKDYGLESIGDGNPYSEDGYGASSSLE